MPSVPIGGYTEIPYIGNGSSNYTPGSSDGGGSTGGAGGGSVSQGGAFGNTSTNETGYTIGNSVFSANYIAKLQFSSYTGLVSDANKGVINSNYTTRNGELDSHTFSLDFKIGSLAFGTTDHGITQSIGVGRLTLSGGISLSNGFSLGGSYTNSNNQISEYGISIAPKIGADVGMAISTFPEWYWLLGL